MATRESVRPASQQALLAPGAAGTPTLRTLPTPAPAAGLSSCVVSPALGPLAQGPTASTPLCPGVWGPGQASSLQGLLLGQLGGPAAPVLVLGPQLAVPLPTAPLSGGLLLIFHAPLSGEPGDTERPS